MTEIQKQISLQNEINESKTSNEIKEKTISLLQAAKSIVDETGNKNIKKEYEDLRQTTIEALDFDNPITEAKTNLAILNDELSNGEITKNEFQEIQKEFDELNGLDQNKLTNIFSIEKTSTNNNLPKINFNASNEINKKGLSTAEAIKIGNYNIDDVTNYFNTLNIVEKSAFTMDIDNIIIKNNDLKILSFIINNLDQIGTFTKSCPDRKSIKELREKYIDLKYKELSKQIIILRDKDGKPIDKSIFYNSLKSSNQCNPLGKINTLENLFDQNGNQIKGDDVLSIIKNIISIKKETSILGLDSKITEYELDLTEYKGLEKSEIINLLKERGNITKNDIIFLANKIYNNNTISENQIILSKSNSITNFIQNHETYFGNKEAKNSIKEYLRENKTEFLKIINDLDIYGTNINDINIVIDSAEYAYLKLSKHKNLNTDGLELLSLLEGLINLKKENEQITKKEINIEKKETQKNKQDKNIDGPSNKVIKHKYKDGSTLEYTDHGTHFNIDNGTQEGIHITEKEFESIKKNPEAKENLFNFKNVTDELNIDFIFNKREDFIKLVNYLNPSKKISLNDSNYINSTELINILNTLITLTGNKKSDDADLESIKTILKGINNTNINKEEKDNRGSPIEKILKNKGIIGISSYSNYFIKTKAKETIQKNRNN